MNVHQTLNYVEFPCGDLAKTKAFFTQVFAWQFQDYGDQYCAFSGAGLDGGFFYSPLSSTTANGAALLVFYSQDIAATQATIEASGGVVNRPVYDFPGGRRFHFCEPSGNEFAVWTDVPVE